MKLKPLIMSAVLLAGIVLATSLFRPESEEAMLGHGRVENLQTAYDKWKMAYEKHGGDHQLVINLAHNRAFSRQFTSAQGQVRLDLKQGQIVANVNGLDGGKYQLWLLGSPHADGARNSIAVGELVHKGGNAQLVAKLPQQAQLTNFTIDQVVIAPTGGQPEATGLLFGSPGLFQRIYHTERLGVLAHLESGPQSQQLASNPFDFLLPKTASAHGGGTTTFKEKIEHGRRLFVSETFAGNGRTCATCHRPDNNHTIDPRYIAKLSPKDPLFIAEHNPNLKNLEKPKLLRQMGLVLANVDGFDKPGVMRAVPHLLALSTSIQAEQALKDNGFASAIGWSGDGAPGDGSLRMFAVGAITQHMPKTLNRVAGVDFRLPTNDELDEMEAYLLSLGRAEDINMEAMTFHSPIVERGRQLFDTRNVEGTGKCAGCHYNGGASDNVNFGNNNHDTGVENMADNPADLLDPNYAYDGGFGREARHNCGPKGIADCYGNARFNTSTVIDSVDTPPYFHNHSVNTLEEAIAYYNTDEFNNSPGAVLPDGTPRKIKISSSQVTEIGLFLRTLSAIDNINIANHLIGQALEAKLTVNAKRLVRLAIADTEDGIEVLEQGAINVYPEALKKMKSALKQEQAALEALLEVDRDILLAKARLLNIEARAIMVTEL